jgi:small subunit ribosomal protein S21
MPKVIQRDKEYFDRMLSRFRKQVEKAGIINEVRRREFYEKPCDKRNRIKSAAIRRSQKQAMKNLSMAHRGRLRNVR